VDSLSIVVPAYNEGRRLPATLERLCAYLQSSPMRAQEIVVVDDGSSDETAEIVREWSARNPLVRLVENPGNRGKGYAVRAGFGEARCEWVLFTDADLSTPIEELLRLEAAITRSGADGAIGSRALDRSLVGKRQAAGREISGRVFNLFVRLVTGLPYRDTQCGFKLFRRDVAQALAARQRLEGFGFDVEILYIARRLGYRIEEVAVRWYNAEGTKVSLAKGLATFGDPLRVRWNDLRGRYYRRG
jgi:glycosyltransferase involved in cell wall biosynthesis